MITSNLRFERPGSCRLHLLQHVLRCARRQINEFFGLLCGLSRESLDEVALQLRYLGQGPRCCDRMRRGEGRLEVGRQVLRDLLIEHLRVAPRSLRDLRHRFRAVLRGSRTLLAEPFGGGHTLLGKRLEAPRHEEVFEELVGLIKGMLSELLGHDACPLSERRFSTATTRHRKGS
jgi:hypothetical protein